MRFIKLEPLDRRYSELFVEVKNIAAVYSFPSEGEFEGYTVVQMVAGPSFSVKGGTRAVSDALEAAGYDRLDEFTR